MRVGWRVAVVAAVVAASSFAGTGGAYADDTRPTPTPEEKAAALARPAVVYLEQHWSGYVFDEDGTLFNSGDPFEITTRCTGFGVSPDGYVATAGHCVDPGMEGIGREFLTAAVAESIQKGYYGANVDPNKLLQFGEANWKLEGQAKNSPLDRQVFMQRGVAAGGKTTGEALPARVVDFRPLSQGDVALLKLETTDLPAVELAPRDTIEIGTKVLSIGYPGSTDEVTDASFEPTNKDGQISSKKTSGSVPVYETSAALSGGMSGGPTVDLNGRVVGINSFKINGEEQAFNFLAPSSNLAELLTRNGVKPSLGDIDKTFRKGLTDYFAGHYTAAITSFDKVLTLAPTHEQAQEYKTKAAKAREQFGDVKSNDSGLPIGLILGLGGGLVVLVGGGLLALLLVRSRRKARPQQGMPIGAGAGPVVFGPGPGGPGYGAAALPSESMSWPTVPMQGGPGVPPMGTPAGPMAPSVSAPPTSGPPVSGPPVSAPPVSGGAMASPVGAGAPYGPLPPNGPMAPPAGAMAPPAGAMAPPAGAMAPSSYPAPGFSSADGSTQPISGVPVSGVPDAPAPEPMAEAPTTGSPVAPAQRMRYCANCGSQIPGAAKFCMQCGTPAV